MSSISYSLYRWLYEKNKQPTDQAIKTETITKDKNEKSLEQQLKSLHDVGFYNDEENKAAIEKFNGNLSLVVQYLLLLNHRK